MHFLWFCAQTILNNKLKLSAVDRLWERLSSPTSKCAQAPATSLAQIKPNCCSYNSCGRSEEVWERKRKSQTQTLVRIRILTSAQCEPSALMTSWGHFPARAALAAEKNTPSQNIGWVNFAFTEANWQMASTNVATRATGTGQSTQAQQEHLQMKFVGTGHPDTTK